MDEKHAPKPSGVGYRPSRLQRRFVIVSVLILLILYSVFPLPSLLPSWWQKNAIGRDPGPASGKVALNAKRKVELEAHVMSKCPDARDCLRDLVVPAMEQVGDLVDFRLSFIGTVDKADNTTVHCMHGPKECLGNVIALCAQELYPDNAKISLGFANCLISSYKDIPARPLVESCAREHAVDFGKLNDCMSTDGHGEELLRSSVLRSKEEGVVLSCTVRVDRETWCVRDGGHWKECNSGSSVETLVSEVKRRASGKS